MDGPQISTSSKPTLYPRDDNDCDNCVDRVLFPTPPFPLSTSMTCDTSDNDVCNIDASFSLAAMAAGEEYAPEEQADWFGQPAQAEDLPASCEVGPTHPALASEGASMPSEEDMIEICEEEDIMRNFFH